MKTVNGKLRPMKHHLNILFGISQGPSLKLV